MNDKEQSDITRRRILQSTGLAAAAIPAAGLLGACATSGGGEDEDVALSDNPENPFDVDEKAPLNVVIFNGGFGDSYAVDGHQVMYQEKFPEAKITNATEEDISSTQQPRFADGEPPDVLDNSGAKKIAPDTLVKEGLLAELTPLLEAPSYDDETVSVRDSLVPGALRPGFFTDPESGEEKLYYLNYAMGGWALWYDQKLFDDKGWTVPTSWDEMIALCADIKKDGVAPWTYAGQHPYYLWDSLFTLASRHGGREVSQNIDNLEPDAWKHDSIKLAAEALYSLQDKGYVLSGTPGINHTDSQTKWNHGEAAFLPCGSWLANEQGDEAPEGFVYSAIGIPALEGSKQPELVWSSGEEPFCVPAQAANKPGGYEYLRIMLSKEGSKIFSDKAQSPSVLADQEIDNEPAKALAALVTSEDNVYRPQIQDWYVDFKDRIEPVLGEMMAGETTPDDFIDAAQKAADEIAEDDSVDKF
ncbi:MAG: N-acetylglucosamine/diacetylchitobiose ABC transporter substrate-binding protein, partial [Stackebrandtia sp.]